MTYALGVDLGTTFTAAAIAEPGRPPQMLSLGSQGYSIPSVLFLRDDGTFVVGEAAQLRSAGDPSRVARFFKRRLGDEIPVRLAGTPFAPQVLITRLLESVLALVAERKGGPPDSIVLTHPANWGRYRLELFEQAAAMAGAAEATFLTEPEAAAIHYVESATVEPGKLIGVYDLGGGTFDSVVMRRTDDGFELVGRPFGVERLGGIDFDDVIRSFVSEAAGVDDLEPTDENLAAAHTLLTRCIEAKRLLTVDNLADVPVVFPQQTTSVRVRRSEFEDRIRPRLLESVGAFGAAIQSAGIATDDLDRILLVGGSSRIPMVAQLLATEFGRPIAVDSDPKNTVALGAALTAVRRLGGATPADAATSTTADDAPPILDIPTFTTPGMDTPTPAPPPAPAVDPEPAPPPDPGPDSTIDLAPAPDPGPVTASPEPRPAPPVSREESFSLPSTESATRRLSAPAPPHGTGTDADAATTGTDEASTDDSELLSVRAESGHRVRITPIETSRLPEPEPPPEVEEVGIDPRLFVTAAVLLAVVVAVVAAAVVLG